MKILKKITIAVVAGLMLVQLPFMYRRHETGKTAEAIAADDANRQIREHAAHDEYIGVIHVHTSLGGHSNAGFEELIDAANSNGLDFVVMTEHYSDKFDTAALTLNGTFGKTLFVGGNEVDTADGDRFLLIPGSSDAAEFRNVPTHEFLRRIHERGQLAFITHPERFKTRDANFDGIEAFSLHSAVKNANPVTAAFDLLWTFPEYPELLLAKQFERPDEVMRIFDETSKHRKTSIFGGTDAHSNIGFHLLGDKTGEGLLGAKLDPYESAFRLVRLHILLPKGEQLSRETLVSAMRAGNFFTGFDILGDTRGAAFTANGGGAAAITGDEIPFSQEIVLTAFAPQPARFNIYKNGELFAASDGAGLLSSTMTARPDGPGVYRAEVYRETLGDPFNKMPWILFDPIYLR